MTSASGAPLRTCTTESYAELAATWRPGDAFPVVACAELERYVASLGVSGPSSMPPVEVVRWAGVVASVGEESVHSCARLLAVTTGRPHVPLAVEDALGWLARRTQDAVALVALPDALSALDGWTGAVSPEIGLVTGHDLGALSTLVYRTLTIRARLEAPDVVVLDAGLPLRSTERSVSLSSARASGPARVLSIAGHGRECALSLADGVVCGRTADSVPAPPGSRAPACFNTGRCFRHDLDEADIWPAASVDALVVVAQGCATVSVGVHAYPASANLGLGLLSGTAVAVVGTVGVHVLDRSGLDVATAHLRAGSTLGHTLRQLNRPTSAASSTLRFGLLGDPGLSLVRPYPCGGVPNCRADAPSAGRYAADGTLRLREIHAFVLPRLRGLRWLGLPLAAELVNALEEAVRTAGSGPETAADRLPSVEGALDAVQRNAITSIVRDIEGSWWDLFGSAASSFREIERRAVLCPVCGGRTAADVLLEHRIDRATRARGTTCFRCGDLDWATATDRPISHSATGHLVSPPTTRTLPIEVRNDSGVRARVHLGFAVVGGFNVDINTRWTQEIALAVGESRTVAVEIDLTEPFAATDEHRGMFISLADGVCRVTQTLVSVRDGSIHDGNDRRVSR